MKKNKAPKGDIKMRQLIVNEAARLMYQSGVSQYHTAKYMAARKVLSGGGKNNRIRKPSHLPSNGEINEAVNALAEFYEGEYRQSQLFAMRIIAFEYMQQLDDFSPRLIGSVSTGKIKKTSDIDIHVFTDLLDDLLGHIDGLGWRYDIAEVSTSQKGLVNIYTHIYIEEEYPIELSVYSKNEIRIRTRSSIDGKSIIRVSANKLFELILAEHEEQWKRYIGLTGE